MLSPKPITVHVLPYLPILRTVTMIIGTLHRSSQEVSLATRNLFVGACVTEMHHLSRVPKVAASRGDAVVKVDGHGNCMSLVELCCYTLTDADSASNQTGDNDNAPLYTALIPKNDKLCQYFGSPSIS